MENLLDEQEAADFLKMKVSTLRVWRSEKRYNLPYYKIGRSVKYKKEDLINFIEQNKITK